MPFCIVCARAGPAYTSRQSYSVHYTCVQQYDFIYIFKLLSLLVIYTRAAISVHIYTMCVYVYERQILL